MLVDGYNIKTSLTVFTLEITNYDIQRAKGKIHKQLP